jgi:DNA-binding GntR family transcriptional regulator
MNLKQKAYETIKAKILNCEYAPNEFLNEQLLCNELGSVSRTPVRDAIGRLEQEGLVKILPKKGILVAPLNISEINLIYEMRQLLEPYALLHYGDRIPVKKLIRLQKILDQPSRAQQDHDYFYEIDSQFHQLIIDATQNRYIINAYRDISNTSHRIRILTGNDIKSRVEDTFREHQAVVVACLEHDWETAAKALSAHLECSRTAAFHLLIQNGKT